MHAFLDSGFLDAIEQSGFSIWVRESGSLWSYPGIVFLHTVGLGLLVGLNLVLDLRLLGFATGLPLAAFGRFFRVMWAAFWINAVSGLVLVAQDAHARLANPVFYVKMLAVAGGVAVMVALRRRVGDVSRGTAPGSSTERTLAVASLVCWTGAIVAGRLMAQAGAVVGGAGR